MEARASNDFIVELRRWRERRRVSKNALGRMVDYEPSYISKVESGAEKPSSTFVERVDEALRAGGALRRAFAAVTQQPSVLTVQPALEAGSTDADSAGGEGAADGAIIVERDRAQLHFDGLNYTATITRHIRNQGDQPINRHLIRISVDRFPGNTERSDQFYRATPLLWEELDLRVRCGPDEMKWEVLSDRDAIKEIWLRFESEDARFPLYPGEMAVIEYSYKVPASKWGPWFQRAIRLPTERLEVQLSFPARLAPAVWGIETSTSRMAPFQTAIDRRIIGDTIQFDWSTANPPLHARFRLEWRFQLDSEVGAVETPLGGHDRSVQGSSVDIMRSIGIVQEGDDILTRPAKPFVLPDEIEDARRVLAELASATERVLHRHSFVTGMGIAAPQIGIDRAVAIVRTPGQEAISLINPRIVETSPDDDDQYEGCLSFFDVRGIVRRPLSITVEHFDLYANRLITVFERGIARLVGHEIDHLHGILYRQRMPEGATPIPTTEDQI